jgi:hypothetical protein
VIGAGRWIGSALVGVLDERLVFDQSERTVLEARKRSGIGRSAITMPAPLNIEIASSFTTPG